MHGTTSVNMPAPREVGTSVAPAPRGRVRRRRPALGLAEEVDEAHARRRVVAASRRLDVDLRGQGDREDLALRALGDLEREAQGGRGRVLDRLHAEHGELGVIVAGTRAGGGRPGLASPRRSRALPARAPSKNAATASSIARPPEMPSQRALIAHELVAAVDRHDRAARAARSMRSTISASTSASSSRRIGFAATSSSQAARSSSRLGRAGRARVERDHAARAALRGRTRARSGSEGWPRLVGEDEVVEETVRVPVGRSSGSPARIAKHGSQEQRMRRSTSCSRWRWSSPSELPQRSQAVAAAARGACEGGAPRDPAQPAHRRCGVARHGASATSRRARRAAAAARARAARRRRRRRGRRAAGRSPARSRGTSGGRRRARRRERRAAARAGVVVGEQRPVDVRDDQLAAARRRARWAPRARLAGGASGSRPARRRAPVPRAASRGRRAGGGSAMPSTSRPSRSGAASSSACLIASSSVAADAGQRLQWPTSRCARRRRSSRAARRRRRATPGTAAPRRAPPRRAPRATG